MSDSGDFADKSTFSGEHDDPNPVGKPSPSHRISFGVLFNFHIHSYLVFNSKQSHGAQLLTVVTKS